MSAPSDDLAPDSADARPRLGDLLLHAGLITREQLDASLATAQAAGKPLGHVLVDQGLVPAHSIAMALADQHGGPLKTEFGFATGRGAAPRSDDLPGEAASAPPVLRLAPAAESDVPEPVTAPVQPAGDAAQLATETAARLGAEAKVGELLVRVAELEGELDVLRARLDAQTTSEGTLAATHEDLATALAAEAALHAQLVAEREARVQDAETVEAWRVQLEAAHAQNVEAAEAAESLRAQLDELLAAEAALAAEREAHQVAVAAADALRARITELEAATNDAPATAPLDEEVDHLRAVIELQEQALDAAAARERAREIDARVVATSSARSYAGDLHFLFAPGSDGYEVLQRSGPAPSPGEVVELSGDRTCRVLRVGPAPFPGAREACAYLELV